MINGENSLNDIFEQLLATSEKLETSLQEVQESVNLLETLEIENEHD